MGLQGQISKEFEKAKQSGKFFVMISYIEKETDILQHRTFIEDFPMRDFDESLRQHANHLTEARAKAGGGIKK